MNFVNYKVYIKDTGNQNMGKGLFAKEKIFKGEVVCNMEDDARVVPNSDVEKLPEKLQGYCYDISDADSVCPKDFNKLSDGWFMNHSCSPNCGATPLSFYQAIAMRDIEAGEELTYDYAMSDSGDFEFECFCGKPNCRKRVRGTDWKIPELQEKYKGYFQKNIQEKIDVKK